MAGVCQTEGEIISLKQMKQYNKNNVKIAKILRKNATVWENTLWYKYLKDYPVRFQRQKSIGNFIVDFYCAKARLVVELDGGGHFLPQEIQKDLQRTTELQKQGLCVIRICNNDIDNNFEGVCLYIDKVVKQNMAKN